jgi:hypothetical protein
MTISGSGYDSNPQNIMWFCHLCNWAGSLPLGEYHQCKSTNLPADTGEMSGGESGVPTEPQEANNVATRFGWLLYRLGVRGLPVVWRLSGYARRDLDVDRICPRCYAAWSSGDWFWRWCRRCSR